MPGDKIECIRTGFSPGAGFSDVTGSVWTAATSGGKALRGWIPDTGAKDPSQPKGYWCHGRTLGTHALYGYSLFGEYVEHVLMDEYTKVAGGIADTQPGDVVLFRKAGQTEHTCLVIIAAQTPRTAVNVHVWTKDGAAKDRVCLLNDVIKAYPECTINFWRPKTASSSSSSSSSGAGAGAGGGGTDSKAH